MAWMTFHLSEWIAAQLNPLSLNTGLLLKDTIDYKVKIYVKKFPDIVKI